MTRHAWHLDGDIYRLRPEGGPPGSSVVSLWLERNAWHWTLWQRGEVVARGGWYDSHRMLPNAQRLAVDHARRLGLIGENDEVTT